MTSPTPTIVFGLGPIGRRIAAVAAAKESLDLVGAVDVAPALVGRPLSELVPGARRDLTVSGSLDDLLATCSPAVALHATGSYLARVEPQFRALAEAGINVVSTCEELVWPATPEAAAAAAGLDGLFQARGARLLGTGINPGYAMDLLPLILSATLTECRRIEVHRIVDASSRREPLQRKVGAGMSVPQFEAAVAEKAIGHVGLAASAHLLGRGLGRTVEEARETIAPVVAEGAITTEYFRVEPGQVAGLRQELSCRLSGGLELLLHLEMYLGAAEPRDEVVLQGDRVSTIRVGGGFAGDSATAALVANCVAPLLRCRPGLRTMLDLPAVGCAP